jgi:heme-degrading monooxygenase HmoA
MQLDKIDQAAEIFKNSIVPAAKEQKGFKGANLFTDNKTGKFISITLWETEGDMAAGDSSGYLQEQLGKVAAFFASPPIVEQYTVSV